MKFCHIADCHVGSWRDSKMKEVNLQSFSKTIDLVFEENSISPVSFVIIAGDLFNTAVPSIEGLKVVTERLKDLSNAGIKVFGIAGSHDQSVSGKSMLEVLEKAELFENLMKGSIENKKLKLDFAEKNGIKLTGIIGKKGTLEKEFYNNLDYPSLENATGDKIFAFHTAIEEFVPDDLSNMESAPLALLPRGFNYYAGGHVHYRFVKETLNGTICFPGPTCPNNFKEFWDLEHGSFAVCTLNEGKVKVQSKEVRIKEIKKINIDSSGLTPVEVENAVKNELNDVVDKIVLIKIQGQLLSGNSSDIHFNDIIKSAEEKGAYSVLRNTSKLNVQEIDTDEFEHKELEEIEKEIIDDQIKESKLIDLKSDELSLDKQIGFINSLMKTFSIEKEEGETNTDFEERIQSEFEGIKNGLN